MQKADPTRKHAAMCATPAADRFEEFDEFYETEKLTELDVLLERDYNNVIRTAASSPASSEPTITPCVIHM